MVSPDLNAIGQQPTHTAPSGVMAHDISQLPAAQSYAGVNYLPIQQSSQLHAPMVAGDVFSNSGAAGATMMLDTPNGYDYALHEVRLAYALVG